MNLILRTRAYRNVLFDLVLSALHVWVAVSYEKWRAYLMTRHWKVRKACFAAA